MEFEFMSNSILEKLYNDLLRKEYFTTDESMILLNLSKPTILRKFKEWEKNHDSVDGIAHTGTSGNGRSGFKVHIDDINKYAKNHAICQNWNELLMIKLNEKLKNMGVDKVKNELILLDLLIKNYQLDLEYELNNLKINEKNKENSLSIHEKIIKIKKQILKLEYEKQLITPYSIACSSHN